MAISTSNSAGILSPEAILELFVKPVTRDSVAAQVATVVNVAGSSLRIPTLESDSTASWSAEGSELAISDPDIDEIDVVFKKVTGLVVVSNELLADSNGLAQQTVGDGLARSTQKSVDAAYFGSTVTNGPNGIASVSGISAIDAGAAWDSLDSFYEAIAAAENVGATIAAFVTTPAIALTLALLKVSTGSLQPLLGSDVTAPQSRTVAGVPLLVSPAVGAGIIWGVPAARTYLAIRSDVTLDVDASPFFTKDSTAIRSTMRVGIAFPHPAAITKSTLTP